VQRMVTNLRQLASRGGPAIDGLPLGVYEINTSGPVNSSTGDIEEATRDFLQLRALGKNWGRFLRADLRRSTGNRQPGEFALPDLGVVGLIVDCGVEGHFAVAVAVHVAKPYVPGVCNCDRIREGLIAAYDAIHVQVRKGDVAGIPDVERQSEAALAPLLFRLQRIDLPVGHMVQNYLVADVMLARQFT